MGISHRTFIADDYSIADIMNYTWASGGLNFIRSAHPDKVENLAALDRWVKTIGDRPAVKQGLAVLQLPSAQQNPTQQ
jgi:GSH-dependent disulfide-bond oxidoreductase